MVAKVHQAQATLERWKPRFRHLLVLLPILLLVWSSEIELGGLSIRSVSGAMHRVSERRQGIRSSSLYYE